MADAFDQRITFTATLTVNRSGLNWDTAKAAVEQAFADADGPDRIGELALIRVTGLESIDDYEERS